MDITILAVKITSEDPLESINLRDMGSDVVMTFTKANGDKRSHTLDRDRAGQLLAEGYTQKVEQSVLHAELSGWSYISPDHATGGWFSLWMERWESDVSVDVEFAAELHDVSSFSDGGTRDFEVYGAIFTEENWLLWMKTLREFFSIQ